MEAWELARLQKDDRFNDICQFVSFENCSIEKVVSQRGFQRGWGRTANRAAPFGGQVIHVILTMKSV